MTEGTDVKEYINSFYRPISPEMEKFRAESEESGIPVILRETEMVLGTLLSLMRPHAILEIGTAAGYSACFMSLALEGDARITTIEQDYARFMEANDNVSREGCADSVHLICDDAVHAMKQLKDSHRMFDFVFIDASKSHYREFWDEAMPLIHHGSVIVCDNVLMRGTTTVPAEQAPHKHRTNIRNMREFLEYITSSGDFKTTVICAGDGMSISSFR
ncbi:MAG: O-methyltransferase [Anaerovoracaceae bacterium]|nr:O-methyltransferase [Anaerovoracaceae bacterium]